MKYLAIIQILFFSVLFNGCRVQDQNFTERDKTSNSNLNIFSQVTIYPLPRQVVSDRYSVTINGKEAPVALTAINCHFVNFDFTDSVKICITAKDKDYWKNGTEIRPFSKGIYPHVEGETVTFTLKESVKLSLERRGKTEWNDEVLYIFANAPEEYIPDLTDDNVIYLGPGYHQQNINLESNQTLYLHGSAVLMGSVNVWHAKNVKILGRGWIIHDGNQDPHSDEASKQIKNWHPITAHTVDSLTIKGVVLTARSRTWTIQTTETFNLHIENIKIITGFITINGDGIDMYGGGKALIKDCFIRGTDDMFAFYHEWWGEKRRLPTIHDITITGCVFWPSQANIIRIGWDGNQPDTRNFTMTDCDIIHMQKNGEFNVPFSLLCIWGGSDHVNKRVLHRNYLFENIRFDHGAGLVGMKVWGENQELGNFTFRNIQFLDEPDLKSILSAKIDTVVIERLRYNGRIITNQNDVFSEVSNGVTSLRFIDVSTAGEPTAVMHASISNDGVMFDANSSTVPHGGYITSYKWNLGDGTIKNGIIVSHCYHTDDTNRVISLEITDNKGKKDFTYARLKALLKK